MWVGTTIVLPTMDNESKFVLQSWWTLACHSHGLFNNMEYSSLNPSILSIVVLIKNSKLDIWIRRSLNIPMSWTCHWFANFTWKGEFCIPCNPNHIQREFIIMFILEPPSINVHHLMACHFNSDHKHLNIHEASLEKSHLFPALRFFLWR
jgi:hypothetical protein